MRFVTAYDPYGAGPPSLDRDLADIKDSLIVPLVQHCHNAEQPSMIAGERDYLWALLAR